MITSNTLIALTHPIAATAMGGILLLLWWVHKDLRFLMFFGLTYLAYGIANSLQVLLWPSSYLINYLLTGVLYAFAALTMYGGIIALDNFKPKWSLALFIVITFFSARLVLGIADNPAIVRVSMQYAMFSLLMFLAVWQVRALFKEHILYAFLLYTFLLFPIITLVRLSLTSFHDFSAYGYDNSAYWTSTQLFFNIFGILIFSLVIALIALHFIRESRQQLGRDELTGLFNRRGFTERCERELVSCTRYSLIALDLDHFKRINDVYGHPFGDLVLRIVAERIQRNIRPFDVVGRIGGEEFLVLLPDAGIKYALNIAERLRQVIERDPISYDANNTANERAEKVSITASFGVVEASAADFSTGFDAVYQQADDLLYQAKNKGRNCVRTVHT